MKTICLTFRELRCATSGFETVFLSFLHSRVTSEKACFCEERFVRCVCEEQRSCNAVTDSACLTGDAAAFSRAYDVEFAFRACYAERLIYDELQCFKTEVFVDVTSVDRDRSRSGIKTNSRDGFLSSTCAIEIRLCACIHYRCSFLQSTVTTVGLSDSQFTASEAKTLSLVMLLSPIELWGSIPLTASCIASSGFVAMRVL